MLNKSLYHQTLAMGVLLLSGCDVAHNAQRDFSRLVHSNPFSSPATASAQARPPGTPPRSGTTAKPEAKSDAKPEESKAEPQTAVAVPPPSGTTAPGVSLVGKSEGQVRAMLGPPTSVEERAPGKTWHYRDGRCSVNVQLYPDVQTRQFGTLAYEVKSDDNSDEGRRDCLGRFRSRAQSGPG